VMQQVPLSETMAMTGHRSAASVVAYTRRLSQESSRAASLSSDL
jgi:hypothetical protein